MRTMTGDGTGGGARRWRRRAAVGLVGAVVAAGCGSVATGPIKKVTTERAVGQAFTALGSYKGLTLTMSLGVTTADVRSFERHEHARGVPAAVATSVPRTSIVMDYWEGGRTLGQTTASSTLAGAEGTSAQFSLDVDGSTPVQLRTTGTTLYAQAQIPALLGDFGAPAATGRQAVRNIEQANRFLPGAAAFGEGHWVSANLGSLRNLEKKLGGDAALPAKNVITPDLLVSLEGAVRSAFGHDTTITNSGDHGGRTEYTVRLASRAFVDQLLASAKRDLSADRQLAPLLKHIPATVTTIPAAQRTVVQVWVEHNRVEELDLDLNQFAHALPFAVPLRVVLGPGTPVSAPSGATAIDLTKLFSGLVAGSGISRRSGIGSGGFSTGGFSTGGSGSSSGGISVPGNTGL